MKAKWIALLCILALFLTACGQTAPDAPANGDNPGSGTEIYQEENSAGENTPDTNEESQNKTESVQEESTETQTESVEQSESEGPWEPAPAPVVRQTVSEEDKVKQQKAILEKGTFLFSGKENEGYYPTDISWLKNASAKDAIALVYACEDESHGGWGVLGLGANVNGNYVQIEDINASTELPKKERLIFYSVQELLKKAGAGGTGDLTGFCLGAWNGGRIAGLYYLPKSAADELTEYLANIEETEQIIHTYTGSLSNENAIESAVTLYGYLKEVWGTACLTGQMESTWMGSPDYEINYIEENTGKLPAIRGLDFMHNDFAGVTKRAQEWWEKGGIPTICWHTGADFSSGYNECKEDDINWEEAFVPGSETNLALINGMDRAVPYLQQLEDAQVPVLWRPFHELDGNWFWWSRGGSENFVKLWQMMYSRYTDYWGLDNLIWVYGYSGNGTDKGDWYPGDSYVDLVGADSYDVGPNGDLYKGVEKVAADGMPIVFHECGTIPTEKELKKTGANWLYFMVWHTDYLTDEKNNTKKALREIYNSDYFITLDELPKFK